MDIEVTVKIPHLIYNIYADAAKDLGDYSVEQVMSCALQAYAQHLLEEMLTNGEVENGDGV